MDVRKFPSPKEIVYITNIDASYRHVIGWLPGPEQPSPSEHKKSIEEYKWREGDFLQANFPRCGTHFVWEIMNMLLNGNAQYLNESMILALIGVTPFEVIDKNFSSPRVLNTHHRLDLLPDQYQNRKTVCVLRNPKDTLVSFYNAIRNVVYPIFSMDPNELTIEGYLDEFVDTNRDTVIWGNYFKFVEYMWQLSKMRSDMLVLFFEDVVRDPVANVKKLNEFMGTCRDDKLIQEIADATQFKKMKTGKLKSEAQLYTDVSAKDSELANHTGTLDEDVTLFRKGVIGDWKNWFTVAMNERFDKYLQEWKPAQEIPFIYE